MNTKFIMKNLIAGVIFAIVGGVIIFTAGGMKSAAMDDDTAYIEQFGAIDDGIADDSNAIQQAFNSGYKK